MKKTSTIIIFMLLIATGAIAQAPAKAKLIGKWKATSVEIEHQQVTLASQEAIRKLFINDRKNLTQEDSATLYATSVMIYEALGNYNMEFRNDDSVKISVGTMRDGTPATDTETSHYIIVGRKLSLHSAGGSTEIVDISMPDPRTIVMSGLSDARGSTLTFTKQ